ncbi:MAG TPA: SUMF1/EgtB/PvdO family nonheme iron enzyme, partial [Planctomycetota bacterium]|nr:SUMF1/EgtB/PvdO family nonheme iron enzyme [Planctomycetota bacterium]
ASTSLVFCVARRSKTNDVLALSAIQELKELVEQADALWPAVPDRLPDYERWLAEARVLVDGSATHPGLQDHEAKLAEIRERAKLLTPEQVELDRHASRSFTEWEQAQARLTWMRRMLGDEPWPSEAAIEAALAKETLSTDADGLNVVAWPLVNPDPELVVYGNEVKALILARRAVAAATDDQRARVRDTLAWALYRCGQLEEALAQEQLAVDEAQDPLKEQFVASFEQLQEHLALWAHGEPRARRADEAANLPARIAALGREVDERRTFEFEDAQDRWWHAQLSGLVADLKAFTDQETGEDSVGTSERHGWGIAKRADFASTIEARSVSGAAAERRWSEAIDAISKSPRYGGLLLTPQLGLLPIGADRESGLWEFWHLQSGDEPMRGADGRLALNESMGLVFVLIPGGTFWMGAQATDPAGRNYDPLSFRDEDPVHEVTLSPYLLSKYEMTQGQWSRFTGRNPSLYGPHASVGSRPMTLLHPVEQVSWDDAIEVLTRLGLALPTEAQWERGARGGTDTPWSTGRERKSLIGTANLADQAAARAGVTWMDIQDWPELDDGWSAHAAVGSLRSNAFGLHDVHGNLWEWCRDGYVSGFYSQSPDTNPSMEPAATPYRVVRGGSFSLAASYSRSANRDNSAPAARSYNLGLRPAKGITP